MLRQCRIGVLIIPLITSLLVGCMVGPNFCPPRSPCVTRYTEYPQPKKTIAIKHAGKASKSQRLIQGRDIPGQWWRLFHSPTINRLVCKGINQNPSIAAAQAALRQANETLNAQVGSTLIPAFNANLTGIRELVPAIGAGSAGPGAGFGGGTPSGSIFNFFTAAVNVTYTVDLFGGLRRQIEALGAQVDFQCYELDATYLTLTANIVKTEITIASLREQIKATRDLIAALKDSLRIIHGQFVLGGASRADVLQQESQLQSTIATLPPLQQSLDTNLHAMSVFIGELPSHDRIPQLDLNKIELPKDIPLSCPTLLVRQRPDILASEALLHSAMAQIGVATANLFPSLNLTGTYGYESLIFSSLGRTATKMWNYAASLTAPIFNGGSLMASQRAAIAAYDEALANYELTVLQAFQNVADSIKAVSHDAQTLKALKAAETAAEQSVILTKSQYKLGGVNFLSLLIAQRQFHIARIARIRSQADRYLDTIALFQALGGGWWNAPPPLDRCCGVIRG